MEFNKAEVGFIDEDFKGRNALASRSFERAERRARKNETNFPDAKIE